MFDYSLLLKATIKTPYLHSNSTTHEFLFGALAELVDNARDAKAQNLKIFTEDQPSLSGGFTLNFLDDGDGMDPIEVADIVQFGKSTKRNTDEDFIGQYGNGLKSGSMRIGKDLILFTKKNEILSILFISNTFFESEQLQEVFVPMPSFHYDNKRPWINIELNNAVEKHELELEIILKYSIFKTKEDLLKQFDLIKGDSGTLVTIFNLKVMENGLSELDRKTDPHDLLMTDFEVEFGRKSQLEHKSFREYVSILYLNPHMKIYLQNKKVRTKMLDRTLYLPRMYMYKSTRFKNRAEASFQKAKLDLKKAEEELIECVSCLSNYQTKQNKNQIELTKLRRNKERKQEIVEQKKREVKYKEAFINAPKELRFIFGINLHNRNADGLFIYNCNRLITAFEHTKRQKIDNEYRGVVGIVNVPYLVLEPTHNKQQFQDTIELNKLVTALSEHLDHYVDKELSKPLDIDFWKQYGYTTEYNKMPPDDDSDAFRKRWTATKIYIQCDNCLKWRKNEYSKSVYVNRHYFPPDEWVCNRSNCNYSDCDQPQTLGEITLSEFKQSKIPNCHTDSESKDNSSKPTSSNQSQIIKKQNKIYSEMFKINKTSEKEKINNENNLNETINVNNSVKLDSNKNNKISRNYSNSKLSNVGIMDSLSTSNKKRKIDNNKNINNQVLISRQEFNTDNIQTMFRGRQIEINSKNAYLTTKSSKTTNIQTIPFGSGNDLNIDKPTIKVEPAETNFEEMAIDDHYDSNENAEYEKISRNFKELLLRVLYPFNDEKGDCVRNTINEYVAFNLQNFSLSDFWKNFENLKEEKIERHVKRRLSNEKERVKQLIKETVDDESYNTLSALIFPND